MQPQQQEHLARLSLVHCRLRKSSSTCHTVQVCPRANTCPKSGASACPQSYPNSV